MKKHTILVMAGILFISGAAVIMNGQDTQAAGKKVKAVVKGSTLTVSGKGALPSSLKVKKKKKVKKIVIKKGITSIPAGAFRSYKNVTAVEVAASVRSIGEDAFRCRKLKKIKIPGDFKIKLHKNRHRGYWITDKVDTVTFNTNLKLTCAAAFDASDFKVKKSDPKYKSIGGVIYTKDKKAVVRVPFRRKKLSIADGCETFCLQSVLYTNKDNEGEPSGGCRLTEITIPASVKKVESERYYALSERAGNYPGSLDFRNKLKMIIKSRQLDGKSFSELLNQMGISINDLMKQVPDQISLNEGIYISDDHVVLKYTGKSSALTVPEGVVCIGASACSTGKITTLILPQSLKEVGEDAFAGNPLKKLQLGRNLIRIGRSAFFGNELDEVTVPASVTEIGEDAFGGGGESGCVITIQGSSKGFTGKTFSVTNILRYTGAPQEKLTSFQIQTASYAKTRIRIGMDWNKVLDIGGYEVVAANNAKYTKNKTTVDIKPDETEKTITIKRKYKKGDSNVVYVKMRPYTVVSGKKIYGRWTEGKY